MTTGLMYEIIVAREFTSHDPEQRAWFLYCYHPGCQGSRDGPYLNRATARAHAHRHAREHGGDTAHIHDHDDRLPG